MCLNNQDPNEEIQKLLAKAMKTDIKYNFDEVIPEIERKINSFLSTNSISHKKYIKTLFSNSLSTDWIVAQCMSILEFITYLKSKSFNDFNDEENKIHILQHFFYDFSSFNRITIHLKNPLESDPHRSLVGETSKPRHISSMQFFLHAKFNFTTYKNEIFDSITPLKIYGTPMLIRQSIEIKIKEMLKIKYVIYKKDKKEAIIKISEYLYFIKFSRSKLFKLPINIDDLITINLWSNNFIHSGYNEFIWKIQTAINVIEPMFTIEDTKNVQLNLEGIDFYTNRFTKDALEKDLSKDLRLSQYTFTFY